ncbi:DUF418 domain-containing protein [Streptomyces sp. NPDC001663]|uniref:DUF418 domain-containing protein n=1 Tax=Streptomyces sp. NPDC001663 TaxID=3364597 RepID=UPI0036CAD3FD
MVSLTAYVVHVLAIWVVGMEEETLPALIALLAFIATAMLLATVWTRWFRRGPLEYVLYVTTHLSRHLK